MAGSVVKPFFFLQLWVALLFSVSATAARSANAPRSDPWVSTWASAQMPTDAPKAPAALNGSTLREPVRVSVGGTALRVRLSNSFGTAPVAIAGVHVARALSTQSDRIDAATDRQLTFSGEPSVIIPAGAEYVSDPVALNVPALATLAVSIRFTDVPNTETGHPGSRATSYIAPGDQLSSAELRSSARVEHWYYLSAIDVQPARPSSAVAVLGDSITDGHGVNTDTNGRWTDVLAERLAGRRGPGSLAVLNLGIGGNRVVTDGLGPNALARFGRDILERSGVRYLIILEGVNDLGVLTRDASASPEEHRQLVERIISAYRQMVARAHDRRIRVIGATIMPYATNSYYHPGPANEADRQAINSWIRRPGNFDALIDFDALVRDPAHPERMRTDYDSGDGLHPSAAGYRKMGEAVPLALFGGAGR